MSAPRIPRFARPRVAGSPIEELLLLVERIDRIHRTEPDRARAMERAGLWQGEIDAKFERLDGEEKRQYPHLRDALRDRLTWWAVGLPYRVATAPRDQVLPCTIEGSERAASLAIRELIVALRDQDDGQRSEGDAAPAIAWGDRPLMTPHNAGGALPGIHLAPQDRKPTPAEMRAAAESLEGLMLGRVHDRAEAYDARAEFVRIIHADRERSDRSLNNYLSWLERGNLRRSALVPELPEIHGVARAAAWGLREEADREERKKEKAA